MQTQNLIVNGTFEASTSGWTTVEGAAAVIAYGTAGYPTPTSPGPADRGGSFAGGGTTARTRLRQQATLPFPAQIDAGTVTFELAGWLGGYADQDDGARLSLEFLSAAGLPLGVCVLGPVTAAERGNVTGLLRRAQSGVVPPGSRAARTVLLFTRDGGTSNDGYADSISLVLTVPTANLLANPGADNGTSGWTVAEGAPVVIAYGTAGYPTPTSPGPPDRGANFFGGGSVARSRLAQTVTLPAGAGSFEFAAYLGGYADQNDTATGTATFLNSTGGSVGVASLGPVTAADRGNVTGLLRRATGGAVPAGARTVRVELLFTRSGGTSNDGYADAIHFGVTPGGS
ncbi:hypothetical protein ACFPIJ_08940 [Dactylosporangium cerinum]|uniref:Minor tail protein n=1 Tax=Dactylosporangium cerinum TaxID=1434730 RepID=A0ABV9VPN1_9ACTN